MSHTLISSVSTQLAAAAPTGADTTTVLLTLGLLALVFYLVKHKRHKLGTAFVGFLLGCIVGTTPVGHTIADTVTEGVREAVTVVSSVMS